MRTLFIAILLILVFPHGTKAQTAQRISIPLSGLKVNADSLARSYTIAFNAQSEVTNLLVRISSSAGETLFLDNQYGFTGSYSQVVKLLDQPPGVYILEIIKDDDKPLTWKLELK